ncbi:hypothetical protein JOQ06_006022 [Pogonophryne albipinna]|uniref:Uncharacterized protein n=1 Tax=Pogonophryne albipinna TaxID=1090488 RepID=A0AAD6FQ21_9TELE|nr:hypothetical protein JOQ06_006022 [Pogonophryne albipinna]
MSNRMSPCLFFITLTEQEVHNGLILIVKKNLLDSGRKSVFVLICPEINCFYRTYLRPCEGNVDSSAAGS